MRIKGTFVLALILFASCKFLQAQEELPKQHRFMIEASELKQTVDPKNHIEIQWGSAWLQNQSLKLQLNRLRAAQVQLQRISESKYAGLEKEVKQILKDLQEMKPKLQKSFTAGGRMIEVELHLSPIQSAPLHGSGIQLWKLLNKGSSPPSGKLEEKVDQLLKEVEELRREIKSQKNAAAKPLEFQFRMVPSSTLESQDKKQKQDALQKLNSDQTNEAFAKKRLQELMHELLKKMQVEKVAQPQKDTLRLQKAEADLRELVEARQRITGTREKQPKSEGPPAGSEKLLRQILNELEELRYEVRKLKKE